MTRIKMGNANGREDGSGSDNACRVDEIAAPQVSMADQDVVQGFPISFDVQTSVVPLQRPDELHIPSPSWMQTSSGYEDMYDEQGVPTIITWS
ncbi:UNVERIFIED_CONTAM: SNF1-related protein kinase regulatory subunit beta-2 [Sesamum latifolium]|uniref:SNF1-related protein kinase regulatory subunit beta-2 n=1 Tax=Sesamum latifolium TaxID=2727402 RepID=A0AAW2Y5Z7_9LAMI